MNASSTTAEEKARLRRQVRAQLSDLSPEELRESDQALFEAFLALPQVEEARSLFLFWGIPGREPETEILVRTLTARGKRVGLPRMLPERGMEVRLFQPEVPMAQVSFGIWEPPESAPLLKREEIQVALVPAVCYDREAFLYAPGNVRVTLDRNLRTCRDSAGFLSPGSFPLKPLDALTVLEVKYDAFLPDLVRLAVQTPDRRAGACSKYALCRRFD